MSDEQLVIAVNQRTEFLTGRDVAKIDADPVLDRRDWFEHEGSEDTIVIEPDEWTDADTEAVADD